MKPFGILKARGAKLASVAGGVGLIALTGASTMGCSWFARGHAGAQGPESASAQPVPSQDISRSLSIAAPPQRTDLDVGLAVGERLAADKVVAPYAIHVDVHDGVVQLSGFADTLLAYQRARRDAELVPGVRSVVNDVVLQRPSDDDAATWLGVTQALQTRPATASHSFDVSVDAGVVTLRGDVDSLAERQLAEDIVSGVPGVVSVDNRTDVRFDAQRPDSEIRADIQQQLADDVALNADSIDVQVHDGIVRLSGLVGSRQERGRAIRDASLTGVRAVRADGLEAPWWMEGMSAQASSASISPATLSRTIREGFGLDPLLEGARPNVTVRHGVAFLTGWVNSTDEMRAAERDAVNTEGVRAVEEDLRLAPVALPQAGQSGGRMPVRALSTPVA